MAEFRIAIPADRVEGLKGSVKFAELLTLARLTNSLRFALAIGFDVAPERTVIAERQRLSSFLLLAASLSESLHTVRRFARHFRHLEGWRDYFVPLIQDTAVTDFRTRVLKVLRNEAVFHNDAAVMLRGFEKLQPRDWTFAEADSDHFMGLGYTLADVTIIRYAFDGPEEDVVTLMESGITETIELAKAFVAAADNLIGEVLVDMGLAMRRTA